MLLKIWIIGCLALLASADNSIESADDAAAPPQTHVEHSVSFETSHKRPEAVGADTFQTSHKISTVLQPLAAIETDADIVDLMQLQETMNLLPTKERPELNPILSALINEDVMKSIEAKRAIEQEELDIIKAEVEEAVQKEERKLKAAAAQRKTSSKTQPKKKPTAEVRTEAPAPMLTTAPPAVRKTADLEDDDINMGFIDQTISLDAAGSENSKKSRIEIKKGPNGQDYEYEYVYYYEEDEDEDKKKPAATSASAAENDTRGKSRYTNIERNNAASAADNNLVSGKAKGRSSSAVQAEDPAIEAERLPLNTRFPSRSKKIDVPPTPALDSLENAAEKKKISVKRPSLELVDSDTFNTDEKQLKGTRNGDNEASKPALALEQEQAAAAAADAAKAAEKATEADSALEAANESKGVTEVPQEGVDQTTPPMQKAALDLYAILANENFNMDMTTDAEADVTTLLPGVTSVDDADTQTTLPEEEPSSTSTTTTTTTTTPAPTTTTTTTTTTATPATLFGGKRGGLPGGARNRYKPKPGSATTTSTTEAPAAASEPTAKAGRNRFSRPSIGGRGRTTARTTVAPAEEEAVEKKESKPVSSGFARGRPRNRFNIRGSSTTEKPAEEPAEGSVAEEAVSSTTTARSLRSRPTLNLRGRSRATTTKAPAPTGDAPSADGEASSATEEKPASAPAVRPSRFNINRPGANRLLPRGKLARTTEAGPAAPAEDDSASEDTHHNDVKGEEGGAHEGAEKSENEAAPVSAAAGGLNKLKSRPKLNTIQKTESAKPKPSPSPIVARKVNPLLAKRRLQLGPSTTEAAPVEDASAASSVAADAEPKEKADAAAAEDVEGAKEEGDTTEEAETTTKAPARGLGLLGQRRRLPLRKPGTIL